MGLNKLQRADCLAITGVMRMTPTAEMEVVLGLPPIHAITEPEAQAEIYRLTCNHKWTQIHYDHTKKPQDTEHEPNL